MAALLITEEETRHLLSVKAVVPVTAILVVEEAVRLAGVGSDETLHGRHPLWRRTLDNIWRLNIQKVHVHNRTPEKAVALCT